MTHTARSVGFTGEGGGVAVFGRALTGDEIAQFAAIAKAQPLTAQTVTPPGD